jgi:hypothetical protein
MALVLVELEEFHNSCTEDRTVPRDNLRKNCSHDLAFINTGNESEPNVIILVEPEDTEKVGCHLRGDPKSYTLEIATDNTLGETRSSIGRNDKPIEDTVDNIQAWKSVITWSLTWKPPAFFVVLAALHFAFA